MADHLLHPGGAIPDDREAGPSAGPALVARLHGLLRAVRIYDLSNQTVRDQLHETVSLIRSVMEDEVLLVAMGQCFYLNGARIRAEPSQIPYFDALSSEFDRRRLGGVRFLDGIGPEELGIFMRIFCEQADEAGGARLGELAAAAGVVRVVPVALAELDAAAADPPGEVADAPADRRSRAGAMYREALRGTRSAILRTVRSGRPAIRRAKRVVQPIIDATIRNEYSVVGLTAIKQHDEYTYAHCLNVSILSIAIGQTLGLPRDALANLGVGALLHDVGKVTVPPEVLGKPGALTDPEWALIRRHPLEGTKIVMHMPGLSRLMLDAMDACLYHHRRVDGRGYPRIVHDRPAPTMARIVAVADVYDSMTTHRSYRARPFTGYEALQAMLGPDRSGFDRAVLWAMVQTVGLYPAGTLLETTSGHMVLSMNNDRDDLRRPQCRVLAHPDGRHALEGPPEVWDPMPRGESVARVVSPERFEAAIDRLLMV